MIKMLSYAIVLIGLLGTTFSVAASTVPVLHDITIQGSADSPELSIGELRLENNKEYLFVLNNTQPIPLEIYFEKLGHHVATRYLQGSSSVSQESLNVLANNKVIWHFVTSAPGEFSLYVVNPSTLAKGEKRRVVIYEVGDEKAKEPEKVDAKKTEQKPFAKFKRVMRD